MRTLARTTRAATRRGGSYWPATALALPAILLFGVVIRLRGLAERPLGGNELFTLRILAAPFEELFAPHLVDNGTQFGFYLLAYPWHALVSNSTAPDAALLRLLPVLFSIATIPLLYLLTRESLQGLSVRPHYARALPLLAAALFAASPAAAQYAQEFRSYSMQLFFLTLASLVALRAAHEKIDRYWWVGYGLSATGALYAHGLSAIFLVAQAGALLLGAGRLRARIIIELTKTGLLAALLTLPLSLTLLEHGPSPMHWILPLAASRVISAVGRLLGAAGAAVSPATGSGPTVPLQDPFMLVLAAIPALIGCVLLARRWSKQPTAVALLLLPLLAVPLIVAVLSLLGTHLWVTRYLLVLLLPLSVVTALGLAVLAGWSRDQFQRRRYPAAAFGLFLLLAGLVIPLAQLLGDIGRVS